MDFPVEATVLLGRCRDERRAQDVLRSHGFQVMHRTPGGVRVRGSFSQLRAVKAELEQLAEGRRGRMGSSGNGYGHHDHDGGAGSRSLPRDRANERRREPDASPTRPGRETFVIDSDVFKYANQLRRGELDAILARHAVLMTGRESGDSSTVSVSGRNPAAGALELQSLLGRLSASLRTQDVPAADVDRDGDGAALLGRIRRDGNVYGPVLVCETREGLHLVGPPRESFDLQQRLMGSPAGRRARSRDRSSRARSSSSPATLKHGGRGATDDSPPPRGAAGFSPPGVQDARDGGAKPGRNGRSIWQRLSFRGRNRNEVRQKAERQNGAPPREPPPPPSSGKFSGFLKLFKNKKNRK